MNNNQLATQSQLFNFKGKDFTVILINDNPHWIAKEVCFELDIKNHSDAINKLKEGSQKKKLSYEKCKQIGLTELQNLQIGTKGLSLLTEAGVYKLAFKSEKSNAEDFTDWVSENVLPSIRKTGRYDSIEENLKLIEDDKERQLSLSLYAIEKALKLNPDDLLTVLNYNKTKQELANYKQDKEIKEIKTEFKELKEDFTKQSEALKKTTVLREGDLTPEAIAKKFNIFSINNNAHNRFADYMARVLGFYLHPEGNAGYKDDYISINLENKFGQTRSVIKYSILAVKEIESYIEENGLLFEEPAQYYKRGEKKGKFKFAYLVFENGEKIKVNETTYKLYSSQYMIA